MKHGVTKTLRVGCILLALFLFGTFALLPQPVRAQTLTATIPVGNGPYGVAFTSDGAYAYVTNEGSGSVSVISTATDKVTASVTLGSLPYAVAITPNGEYIYVTNVGNNTVSVINTATNTLAATVTVGNDPAGVAVTPNGKYVYVANEDALSDNNSVSVINTVTNTVTATISVGRSTSSVAVAPNGKYAYVTSYSNGLVSVISTATNKVTATFPAGLWPLSVTISPNGKYAYVTHDTYLDYISVINTATNTETTNVTVGGNDTQYVAFTPNGEYAYVTVLPAPPKTPGPAPFGNGTVSVINTATDKMTANLAILGEPLGVAISPNGAYAYVTSMTNGGGGTVLVISTPAPTAVQEFPAQSLIITMVVFMIIGLSVVIIAKKRIT
jgi:YVTN family beta-propeller protein